MKHTSLNQPDSRKIVIGMPSDEDLETIYGMRHIVYATELGQHSENDERLLTDELDTFNCYIVAKIGGVLAGFISITPPSGGRYSVDKYFQRTEVPLPFDDRLYELRILTVSRQFRGTWAVPALMFGALRWIESQGVEHLVAIGREGLTSLYEKAGLVPQGKKARSGAVTYELLVGDVNTSRDRPEAMNGVAGRLDRVIDWRLEIPMNKPTAAFHGGAFFDAIGREFDDLTRVKKVISADVLDAWFPPSPKVVGALENNLNWTIVTSPPTGSEGLISRIADVRGVDAKCVLPGTGSSSLIYAALRHFVKATSKALILEPSHGEYSHLLENVIGCKLDRFVLQRKDGFRVDLNLLRERLARGYDWVIIVNPNNPTGQHIRKDELIEAIDNAPTKTRFRIDETYVDYAGSEQSLEQHAAKSENVIVCKSMSKAYALSGLRVGYLCGPEPIIEQLRAINPPWSVGLPAQLAAVMALQDPEYYAERYRDTHRLREMLADKLRDLGGIEVTSSVGNFLLLHLPDNGPDAKDLIARCQRSNLFLRNASTTAPNPKPKSLPNSRKRPRNQSKDAPNHRASLKTAEFASITEVGHYSYLFPFANRVAP